jgi:hypothetical protein
MERAVQVVNTRGELGVESGALQTTLPGLPAEVDAPHFEIVHADDVDLAWDDTAPHLCLTLNRVRGVQLYYGFDDRFPLGVFVPTYREVAVGTQVLSRIEDHRGHQLYRTVVHWTRPETSLGWPGLGLCVEPVLAFEFADAVQKYLVTGPNLFYPD